MRCGTEPEKPQKQMQMDSQYFKVFNIINHPREGRLKLL